MKRLLAICWEMPPLSGPRAVQVTRTLCHLAHNGWHSRVICFGPTSDRYQQDHRVSLEELSGGAAVPVPVPSPEEWLLVRALWRVAPPLKHLPDEKRVWMPSALAEARRDLAATPADLIVSFAQPWTDHLIGLQLHRETGLPWVAHFSDPWVDSPYARMPQWVRRRAEEWEREVAGEATSLVFVNEYTRNRVMGKYPPAWASKAHVVPQGYEHTEASAASIAPGARPMRVVYTGRFYDEVRTPDSVLQALATLNRAAPLAGRVVVEFVGAGMARYQQQAAGLGLEAVTAFPGRVSPQAARERAAAADVLLTIDAPSDDGASLFLPSKLVDYLPMGRPIVGVTPLAGPSADLIRELGYPVVDPRDVAGIAAAFSALLERFAQGALAPSPTHGAVAARFDITETTRAFARVLDAAVEGR